MRPLAALWSQANVWRSDPCSYDGGGDGDPQGRPSRAVGGCRRFVSAASVVRAVPADGAGERKAALMPAGSGSTSFERLEGTFRVAAKHTDRKHPNAALFQVGQTHADNHAAADALREAQSRFSEKAGYKLRLQELVDADGGEARWKDVKS